MMVQLVRYILSFYNLSMEATDDTAEAAAEPMMPGPQIRAQSHSCSTVAPLAASEIINPDCSYMSGV